MELVSEKLVLKAVYFSREDSATTGISTLKKSRNFSLSSWIKR